MRKSKKPALRRKQNAQLEGVGLAGTQTPAAAKIMLQFDRAERTAQTKDIHLITDEGRNIFERPSTS